MKKEKKPYNNKYKNWKSKNQLANNMLIKKNNYLSNNNHLNQKEKELHYNIKVRYN